MPLQELKKVYRTFHGIKSMLEDSFPFKHLVDFTELCRGKPLLVEQDAMPIAMTGYCVALLDVDLICTRTGLDSVLTHATCLHEIAHLLLGHIPITLDGPSTPDYSTFLHHRNIASVVKRLYADQRSTQHELEAETLATLLVDCIAKDQQSAPQLARCLGW